MTCKNWRVSRKTSSFIMEIFMKFLAIALTIIFAVTRIMNLITWSWWLVLSPILIYSAISIFLLICTLIAAWIVYFKE